MYTAGQLSKWLATVDPDTPVFISDGGYPNPSGGFGVSICAVGKFEDGSPFVDLSYYAPDNGYLDSDLEETLDELAQHESYISTIDYLHGNTE